MSGPFVWWANRKSKHGMQVSARRPPHLPGGKEWWTTPPTALPQPEHIEYAVRFACEVSSWAPSRERNTLQQYLSAWLQAARRLLHEEWHAPHRQDLATTDGLIVAAWGALGRLIWLAEEHGVEVPSDIKETRDALRGRGDKIKRERAVERAKRRS